MTCQRTEMFWKCYFPSETRFYPNFSVSYTFEKVKLPKNKSKSMKGHNKHVKE